MTCKKCGCGDLEMHGSVIIGKDRNQEWAKKYLKNMIYTCMSCGNTLGFYEKGEGK